MLKITVNQTKFEDQKCVKIDIKNIQLRVNLLNK